MHRLQPIMNAVTNESDTVVNEKAENVVKPYLELNSFFFEGPIITEFLDLLINVCVDGVDVFDHSHKPSLQSFGSQ